MDIRRNELDQIMAQARQLSSHCDSQTSLKINEITHHLQQQWSTVEQRLHDIVRPSREIVDNWRQFNSSYVHLLDRLSELEARWYSIQREKFTSDIETLVDKAKVNSYSQKKLANKPFFSIRIFNIVSNSSISSSLNSTNVLNNSANIFRRFLPKKSTLNIQSSKINTPNYEHFKINFFSIAIRSNNANKSISTISPN